MAAFFCPLAEKRWQEARESAHTGLRLFKMSTQKDHRKITPISLHETEEIIGYPSPLKFSPDCSTSKSKKYAGAPRFLLKNRLIPSSVIPYGKQTEILGTFGKIFKKILDKKTWKQIYEVKKYRGLSSVPKTLRFITFLRAYDLDGLCTS